MKFREKGTANRAWGIPSINGGVSYLSSHVSYIPSLKSRRNKNGADSAPFLFLLYIEIEPISVINSIYIIGIL